MKTLSWSISAALSLALAACGANSINTDGTTGGGNGTTTGGGAGTSTGAIVTSDYPVPPAGQVYGIAVGNTFPNISLNGGALTNFAKTATLDCPSAGKNTDVCTTSSPTFVSSFTFDDLYHQGQQAPVGNGFRYAFIDISGAWCPHCQQEAQDLPAGYVANWLAEGGVVFSILVQNADNSKAATTSTLFQWVRQYQTNYPISIDLQENMAYDTGIKAWPGNVIVRLSDMQVIDSVLGAGDSFYQTFSKALTQCQGNGAVNDCWSGFTCQSGTCVAN